MNWGKGITIAIVLFMGFIVSFVFRAFSRDADLVRTDYYEHELEYDATIQAQNNYFELGEKVMVNKDEEGVNLVFSENIPTPVSGEILFYRPQSKKMDRSFQLQLKNGSQRLDYNEFFEGFYEITVEWNDGTKDYQFKDEIVF